MELSRNSCHFWPSKVTTSCSKKKSPFTHFWDFFTFILGMLFLKTTHWNVICSRAVFFLLLVVTVIDALNFIDSTMLFTMGWNLFSGKILNSRQFSAPMTSWVKTNEFGCASMAFSGFIKLDSRSYTKNESASLPSKC